MRLVTIVSLASAAVNLGCAIYAIRRMRHTLRVLHGALRERQWLAESRYVLASMLGAVYRGEPFKSDASDATLWDVPQSVRLASSARLHRAGTSIVH